MRAAFDLAQNPFYILRAALSDPPTRIRERAEDAVIDGRAGEIDAARAEQVLASPTNRLEAELSGLIGAEQRLIQTIYDALDNQRLDILKSLIRDLPLLARANVAAHLAGQAQDTNEALQQFSTLDRAWSAIRPETVVEELEPERQSAGIRPASKANVADVLDGLRRRHARVLRMALERAGNVGDVLTRLVESAVQNGALGPFLETLVRDYDSATEPRLADIRERLDQTIATIRSNPEAAAPKVKKVEVLLAEWDEINQPAQLVDQFLGHEEPRSREIADDLRELALHLANEQNAHDQALTITRAVAETFPELGTVYGAALQDIDTLTTIIVDKPFTESLNTLSTLCEHLLQDPTFRDHIRDNGLRRSYKTLPLRQAFATALDATRDHAADDAPWQIMRVLAVDLHNEHQATGAAVRLVEDLINWTPPPPSAVLGVLKNDHQNLQRLRLWAALAAAKDNRSQSLSIIDQLLTTADEDDRLKLLSIRNGLRSKSTNGNTNRPQIAYIVGWVAIIAFGVILPYALKQSEDRRVTTVPTRYTADRALSLPRPSASSSYPRFDSSATIGWSAVKRAEEERARSDDRSAAPTRDGTDPAAYRFQSRAESSPSESSIANAIESSARDDGVQEQKPPIGLGRIFTVAEIRYCEFQNLRLEAARRVVRNNSQRVDFNRLIDDWNRRCSSYRHRPGDMRRIEAEVYRNRTRLEAEGRTFIATTPQISGTKRQITSRAGQSGPSAIAELPPWLQSADIMSTNLPSADNTEEPAETLLDLRDREDAAEAQRQLATHGFYTGPIDGLFGRDSVSALRRFKQSHSILSNDDVWDLDTQRRLFGIMN